MLQLDYAGERVFVCKWSCNFYILWMYSSKDSRILALWSRVNYVCQLLEYMVPTQCIPM